MHHPGCAGSVGLGRLAELWGVGCGESCCSSCTLPRPGRAVSCATLCWGAQHHGRTVLPPRPAPGVRVPMVSQAGSCCPWALPAPFPLCSGGSRMLEWLHVLNLSWPGQELAAWLSLSLKHRCQDVPAGRAFAWMPALTKILFFLPFSTGYTCLWLGNSSIPSALDHVVLPAFQNFSLVLLSRTPIHGARTAWEHPHALRWEPAPGGAGHPWDRGRLPR